MNTQYRYQLERGSKKHFCPSCLKKRLVRFIDAETNEYLPSQYGVCDRLERCSYSLNPYTDRYNIDVLKEWSPPPPKPQRADTFIPYEILEQTFKGYEENTFIQNLEKLEYSHQSIESIIDLYCIGTVTNGYRKGSITLPFIDVNNKVRAIQVKQFNEYQKTISTDFLHSIIEKHQYKINDVLPQWLTNYKLNEKVVSCLFGEHLLSLYPNNPIGLVEAPKTAIYGCLEFGLPTSEKNLLWLAVYNLTSLNYDKCKKLQGRKVILFPDLSEEGTAFNLWNNKAKYFNDVIPNSKFEVSSYLENNATNEQKKNGCDLADFLIAENGIWNDKFKLLENKHGFPKVWD
jgi:hypothetical protein